LSKPTRRALGIVAVLVGIPLIVWSFCPLVLDFLDYTGLADTWNASCPSKLWSKVIFISGIVLLVLGQRLLSGRKLHTGEKAE
jgi:hypothetical protein